jgi:NAD+ synthase (glutamine-hydrolysing)
MATLRVALAQINSTVGDFPGNIGKIGKAISRAKDAGAALVVFPEMAVCGYPPEDLLLRPRFLQDSRAAVEEVARGCRGITAVVGFADPGSRGVYNAAAVIRDGRIEDVCHKMELPNYGIFDEKRYFLAGDQCRSVEVEGATVVVTICEDVWVKEGASERCASKLGAPVVINMSASPFHVGKLAERREILAGFARRTGALVCYANLVGGQDELVFDGGSLIMGSGGEVLASARRFEEALLVADLQPGSGALAGDSPPSLPAMGR